MSQQSFTRTIAAGQAAQITAPGQVLSIKTASLPVNVALDGGEWQPVNAGSVINGPFRFVTFQNKNAVAVTVTFYTGDKAVQFAPADSSQSNAATYAFGNLGIANGASASGGLPACDASGFLQITVNMSLAVANFNNGHRRQEITFCVSTKSNVALNVLDANGFAFLTVQPGQIISLITDAPLRVSGVGDTAAVTIGQIYLSE